MHDAVISASTLNSLLREKPVILDCRYSLQDTFLGNQLYSEGHIPGAFFCNLDTHLSAPKAQSAADGGRHPLPNPKQFCLQLSQWGVNRLSHVVVYDDNRLGFAARAWWLLKAMGVHKVSVLDGGYTAWRKHGYPLDKRAPPLRHGKSLPVIQFSGVTDYPSLYQQLPLDGSIVLIDSRDAARYQGLQEPIDPIAGHIPGAINKPWLDVTDEDGFIKKASFQQQLWEDLPATATPVIYCGSGVTACVSIFSLHLIGRDDAILYPGSWSEWCLQPNSPKASVK